MFLPRSMHRATNNKVMARILLIDNVTKNIIIKNKINRGIEDGNFS